jgi:hypothetical protein
MTTLDDRWILTGDSNVNFLDELALLCLEELFFSTAFCVEF